MEDQLKQRNWFTKKLFDAVLLKSKKLMGRLALVCIIHTYHISSHPDRGIWL
jgi:hypothetical protein